MCAVCATAWNLLTRQIWPRYESPLFRVLFSRADREKKRFNRSNAIHYKHTHRHTEEQKSSFWVTNRRNGAGEIRAFEWEIVWCRVVEHHSNHCYSYKSIVITGILMAYHLTGSYRKKILKKKSNLGVLLLHNTRRIHAQNHIVCDEHIEYSTLLCHFTKWQTKFILWWIFPICITICHTPHTTDIQNKVATFTSKLQCNVTQ